MRQKNIFETNQYAVRLASSQADYDAVYRLRYDVFVQEYGVQGPTVNPSLCYEKDEFDSFCDHLILIDKKMQPEQVVGLYRLISGDRLPSGGRFYTEQEFDISNLYTSNKRLLELSRSCIHPNYRSSIALFCLWRGVLNYVEHHKIDLLFGVASLYGTNIDDLRAPLSYLHQNHLAPKELRPKATGETAVFQHETSQLSSSTNEAIIKIPTLIKSYLRFGSFVGDGAFIDHDFNTTDICMVIDAHKANAESLKNLSDSRLYDA